MRKNNETKNMTDIITDKKTGKKKSRNPWTDTFVQVAEYLVKDYGEKVRVDSEYQLFKKPMRIDAVIIKQEEGLIIDNAVMRFFKKHNIVEFKSPKDTLNIEAFDKTISYFYAYLSKVRRSEVPQIRADDVTITIVSVKKPVLVFDVLRDERNYKIVDTETSGIYHIVKKGFIPEVIQLVISSELPTGGNDQSLLWLRSLRNDLTAEEAVELVKIAEDKDSDDPVRSIVYFLLDANPHTEKEVKMLIAPVSPQTKKWLKEWATESGLFDESMRDVAKNMLRERIPVTKIMRSTGLDENEIRRLQLQST